MRLVISRIFTSRLARLFCAVNLGLMLLFFFQLHAPGEASCAEAVRPSAFDRAVAGGNYFFHYSSEASRFWLFLNLPALLLSALLEWAIKPLTYSAVTVYGLSWIRAGLIVTSTSAQWALIGYGLGKLRRRASYK
jgi:hypothetical protein